MAKCPVAAPRTRLAKQVAVYSDDVEKKPPPVAPKTYKIIKSGGQPLPGMVHSSSILAHNQKFGEGAITMQCASQHSVESKFDAQENTYIIKETVLTQKSFQGDFQQPLISQQWKTRSKSFPTPNLCHQESQDTEDIMTQWTSEKSMNKFESSDTESLETKTLKEVAESLKEAIHVYNYLLTEKEPNLQNHITELEEVAKNTDKVHKGVKIAGITGGTAGAVGVAAAVGGVILSPFTLGASLAVTAVGIGVAAAGGVTGASAAISNKVKNNLDRKKVESILKDHSAQIEEIMKSVKAVETHIEYLKKQDLSTLMGVDSETKKMAKMAHKVGDSVKATGALSKSTGLIQGFALGLDMYFSKEDSDKLKKGSETKFAKQIRKVAQEMQTSLDELIKFKTIMGSENMSN